MIVNFPIDYYLFTVGRFKTTPKNFSRTNSKAVSVTAGFGSKTSSIPANSSVSDSLGLAIPFVAKLCFFRKAAEKPEAHTYIYNQERITS